MDRTTSRITDHSTTLDLATTMKACQSISSELVLSKLLEKLVALTIENAGAQIGFLLLADEQNKTKIEAGAHIDPESETLKSIPSSELVKIELPNTIVNYVKRTQETIILENAQTDNKYSADPYFKKERKLSIFCLPIVKQGSLIGMLYLENNLSPNVFTNDRQVVLKLLASQAAISLEIAKLYGKLTSEIEERIKAQEELKKAHDELETRVIERTKDLQAANEQLKALQKELMNTAHQAGMAEIATSVLHNIGNVLNSVNVSSEMINKKVTQSTLTGKLGQLAEHFAQHQDNLGTYFTQDESAKKIPAYIKVLSTQCGTEYQILQEEITALRKNIENIEKIIKHQQDFASKKETAISTDLVELMEEAVQINSDEKSTTDVIIQKDFAKVDKYELPHYKLLQILVNLIRNAKQAVAENKSGNKIVKLCLMDLPETIQIDIIDNGVGIAPENMENLFKFGFTTKSDGHGFGLHSCANDAQEMGAKLEVKSEGLGKGATFTIILPKSLSNTSTGSGV